MHIPSMKTALAVVCSLLLAWTSVPRQAPGASEVRAVPACCGCDCSQASCCASDPLPEPSPVSAAPVLSLQQLAASAPAQLLWTLPSTPESMVLAGAPGLLTGAVAPLSARHCDLLI